ncbi:Protein SIEVE ELEMENT OCCLUSION [Vigna angularis]|uniref:Protein SIEVE ELEMENT OCCLUSION n=1 Tax=Phaseolus angularis TaxID=3914 RepID=A0A8T0L4N3_PHAAN|nr:Protein SIEVE ELEMENT OCCLUSION [Vigna angularis]
MQRDNLIKKLLLTHDPDGRRLDSEAILLAVTCNLYSASFHKTDITEIETIGCSESVGFIITKICKMLCRCSGEGDINSRVINLFDLIGKYSWDAKVVLVLAAFAVRYGEFWQLMQLHYDNSLAALISSIKKLPCNLKPLKLQIKALSLLVETMMDVAMCIIKYSDSAIIAAWELSSLAYRLSGTRCNLRRQVDLCYEEIERNLYQRLSDLAREEHIDNQKILTLFFPSNNYLPLKDCSTEVKEELWQDQNLTMQLLLDEINPLLAYWVEQGKSICLYGSENLVWIQQFNDKITELKRAGLQLETIYVGNSQLGEHVKQIMARSGATSRSDPLSFTNVQFFWLRLASMLRSKLRLGKTPSGDYVLAELSALLKMDDREEGWAVIGSGGSTDIIRLRGMQVMEFLRKCSVWRENITKFGLWGAPTNILEADFVEGSCTHSYFVPSRKNGRLSQGTVICQVCKRPMKKFVVYKP